MKESMSKECKMSNQKFEIFIFILFLFLYLKLIILLLLLRIFVLIPIDIVFDHLEKLKEDFFVDLGNS